MRDTIRQKGKESSKKVGEKGFHGLRLIIPQAQLQVTPMSVTLYLLYLLQNISRMCKQIKCSIQGYR